jgi:transcriptional regulator with XRE-family HTH domain
MTTSTQNNNQHEELFKSIGKALAKKRESCNLTQEQVSEALQIGTEAVSRMERGITMPTVQRLAELAEIYSCGIEELLIASSTRTSDQAELISQILHTLPEADRVMIVEVVQKIAARLKDRL